MASGEQSHRIEPFLTSEEVQMLQAIDPKYMTRADREAERQQGMRQEVFRDQLANGDIIEEGIVPKSSPLTNPNGLNGSGVDGGAEGGFLPILGPILAAVAPGLIDRGIKWIGGLFRRKDPNARGIFAPNARGVSPPNARGYAMGHSPQLVWPMGHSPMGFDPKKHHKDFMLRHIHNIMKDSQSHLTDGQGKLLQGNDFYRQLMKLVRRYVELGAEEAGVSNPHEVAHAIVGKMFPHSFQRQVHEEESIGSGDSEAHTMTGLIRPIAEHIARHAGKIPEEHHERLKHMLHDHLMKKMGKRVNGGKINWKNVWGSIKGFAKKAASTVLPMLADVAKSALPRLLNSGIDAGVNKFHLGDDKYKDWVSLAHKGANMTPGLIDSAAKNISQRLAEPAAAAASSGSGRPRDENGRFLPSGSENRWGGRKASTKRRVSTSRKARGCGAKTMAFVSHGQKKTYHVSDILRT